MSLNEVLAILALVGWSIYKQSRRAEVTAAGRFKMALIYAIVGLCVGGFDVPSGLAGYAMIAAGLALSVVVGVLRGYLTRVWREPDGQVFKQGTSLTISLFIALIVAKFGLGTWAYFAHIDDGAGFGEVLLMLAIMIALQAQIVLTRAQRIQTGLPADFPTQTAVQR